MTPASSISDSLRGVATNLPFNPKRRICRAGVESWYPYYAGYSPDFARSVLETARLPNGAKVLDPWNGSGTTTYVADQLGLQATGFDLNPVATLVASAKLARPGDAEHAIGLVKQIIRNAESQAINRNPVEPLNDWLRPTVANHYRLLETGVLTALATGRTGVPIDPRSGALPPLASFLILALMRAARSLAAVKLTTNPTWIAPSSDARGSRKLLSQRWVTMVENMAQEISMRTGIHSAVSNTQVADARSLPITGATFDFVLTSPPYCTRIDYVVSTSFELAAVGMHRDSFEFSDLRRTCMGTPLAREGGILAPRNTWPDEIRVLLQAIQRHPSKASNSYYYKTYWQYFSDCEVSLRELFRVLKPGSPAVLVVQSSYYKDIHVDLPQLYIAMGHTLGFGGAIVSEVEVSHTLAQINSRSLQHRNVTTYHESVVILEKPT